MLDAVRLWTPFHIATSRRRLLVLKLDHLGDFIIAVPAMRALRDHFPGDEITLVCGSWNKSLAESTGLFDTIVGYDFFPPNGSQRIGVTQPHSEFLTGTRGEYDIAVDLRVDGDTRFLLSHVNAKVRCGIGAEYEFPYLDIALPKPSRGRLLDAAKAQHAFSAGDFISNVLVSHPLHWETDFSRTDCCVIFGPYATLPIGAYQATFHFGASGLGLASSLCRIELDVANRTLPIATLRLGRRHLRTGSAILTFTNPDEHGAIEFRVSTHGRPAAGAFRFFGVTVESASSDLDIRSRQWSRLLHRGECVSLLVSLLAERTRPSGTRRTLTKRRTADDVLCEEVRAIVETPGAIFIAPISRSPIKDWPLPNYAALIRLILNQNNRVVLLGTDDQRDALDAIGGPELWSDPRLSNLAGKTPWAALPMLFQGAALVISGNSGVAHFAAACGAPILAIFSGTHTPEEWGPRGDAVALTITADVPCSPCGFDDIKHCIYQHRCMTTITPEMVFDKVAQLLSLP